jgi:creatinine amidohydrolase
MDRGRGTSGAGSWATGPRGAAYLFASLEQALSAVTAPENLKTAAGIPQGKGGQDVHRVLMEEMTWVEIKERMAAGATSVFIAVASIEQHGPALPLITDMALGRALGERAARKLGDMLVAPPIAPGCSDHHMEWPGTITVSPSLLGDLVTAWLKAYQHHGFKEAVLVASHGGNFGPLGAICERVKPEFERSGLRVLGLTDINRFFVAWFEALRAAGRDDATAPHADVSESSLMLAIQPELVRADKLETGYVGKTDLDVLFSKGMRYYTQNGVLGDPIGSTADIGRTILEMVSDHIVAEIRRMRQESNV